MANALPLLLLGGAALLMMGGKKKKSGAFAGGQIIVPPTTPPPLSPAVKKSGSGYPGVSRDQMQEIQTMLMANGYGVGAKGLDGRYGPATKRAVWEFQEDWGQGLGVDGKPGPNTRAALKQAEAGRLAALPGSSGDQCNPLDPGTWGAGNVCVFDGSRWVRRKTQVKATPDSESSPPNLFIVDSYAQWLAIAIATIQWPEGAYLVGIVYRSDKARYVKGLTAVAKENPSIYFTVMSQSIVDQVGAEGIGAGDCGPEDVSILGAGNTDDVEGFTKCWAKHPSVDVIAQVSRQAIAARS